MLKTTLRQQLKAFENQIILDSDGTASDCFNFYDWFCKDSLLERKAAKLFPAVKRFVKERNIDVDKVYVFFKNNCPVIGPLYDDFRICDLKSGDVIWTVIPKRGHSGKAEVWGKENDFKGPIAVGRNMSDIYKMNF